jgi:D-amino-acid dehydrogenase
MDTDVMPWRKDMIMKYAKQYVSEKDFDESKANLWVGLRPVCSDDVPLIGKSSKFSNLYWNTGHGARGITQAAGSADLLSNLIAGDKVTDLLDANDYDPSRFGL